MNGEKGRQIKSLESESESESLINLFPQGEGVGERLRNHQSLNIKR